MVNNISMSTMDFPTCLPPPLLFFSPALSHTHTQLGGKNDLSAALNSLHFYSPEWTSSTKGDIIFSGLDWPPPCHRMTSCAPPRPPIDHNQQQHTTNPPLHVLGCWVPKTTEASGQDLAIYCGLAVHNELRRCCSCVCGKQPWEMTGDGRRGGLRNTVFDIMAASSFHLSPIASVDVTQT